MGFLESPSLYTQTIAGRVHKRKGLVHYIRIQIPALGIFGIGYNVPYLVRTTKSALRPTEVSRLEKVQPRLGIPFFGGKPVRQRVRQCKARRRSSACSGLAPPRVRG